MLSDAAFGALYTDHAPAIQRYFCGRHLLEQAPDLTHDTFERAWRARERFTGGTPLPWLYRIANNLATDWWRRHRRHGGTPTDVDLLAGWMPAGDASDPECLALRNERRRAVHATLAQLGPKQRAALWQYRAQGIPAPQNAAIKTRLYLGKRRFAACYPAALRGAA